MSCRIKVSLITNRILFFVPIAIETADVVQFSYAIIENSPVGYIIGVREFRISVYREPDLVYWISDRF